MPIKMKHAAYADMFGSTTSVGEIARFIEQKGGLKA
jgi:hypothetical protein